MSCSLSTIARNLINTGLNVDQGSPYWLNHACLNPSRKSLTSPAAAFPVLAKSTSLPISSLVW